LVFNNVEHSIHIFSKIWTSTFLKNREAFGEHGNFAILCIWEKNIRGETQRI